ncbi:MAG: hypothetical protein IPL52_11690 [Flavobacteriales bacterium]|nr:hypothetical protein [Flavobacteriales bacterium]
MDVNDVTHVIHFDLPGEAESYTHRSGRTARAGRTGISLSIIGVRDVGKVRQLERALKTHFTYIRVPGAGDIGKAQVLAYMQAEERGSGPRCAGLAAAHGPRRAQRLQQGGIDRAIHERGLQPPHHAVPRAARPERGHEPQGPHGPRYRRPRRRSPLLARAIQHRQADVHQPGLGRRFRQGQDARLRLRHQRRAGRCDRPHAHQGRLLLHRHRARPLRAGLQQLQGCQLQGPQDPRG